MTNPHPPARAYTYTSTPDPLQLIVKRAADGAYVGNVHAVPGKGWAATIRGMQVGGPRAFHATADEAAEAILAAHQ